MEPIKSHPIIFTGPMIRAILEGRKTQTRRVIKVPLKCRSTSCELTPGNRLWVRETWRTINDPATCIGEDRLDIDYRADGERIGDRIPGKLPKWRSARFMPRWASRITLEITNVRVERVRDISEDDARAEGAQWLLIPEEGTPGASLRGHGHRVGFAHLWDSLNAKRGFPWSSNPWVWVIEFRQARTV